MAWRHGKKKSAGKENSDIDKLLFFFGDVQFRLK